VHRSWRDAARWQDNGFIEIHIGQAKRKGHAGQLAWLKCAGQIPWLLLPPALLYAALRAMISCLTDQLHLRQLTPLDYAAGRSGGLAG
jgi:hypothetical protein